VRYLWQAPSTQCLIITSVKARFTDYFAEPPQVGEVELAQAGPAPSAGHAGRSYAGGRVGVREVLVGALEPDPPQVPLRSGPEVLLERVPQRKDGDLRRRGDFLYRFRLACWGRFPASLRLLA
jgi:hypothetical protein